MKDELLIERRFQVSVIAAQTIFFAYANFAVVRSSAFSMDRFCEWALNAPHFYSDSIAIRSSRVLKIKFYPAPVIKLVIFEVSVSQVRPSSPRQGAFQSIICVRSFS